MSQSVTAADQHKKEHLIPVLINAAHAGVSNYPENATPTKTILMQRVLLPRSVRQKDYWTALGGERSCYLRLLLTAWRSDLHDRAQMDRQHAWHPSGKDGYGNVPTPTKSIRRRKQKQPGAPRHVQLYRSDHQITAATQTNISLLLQETNTRGLKMRTMRQCNAIIDRFHITIRLM